MSETHALIGLPLEEALHLMGDAAKDVRITRTAPPRSAPEGLLRVLRVREGEIVVAAFPDQAGEATRKAEGMTP